MFFSEIIGIVNKAEIKLNLTKFTLKNNEDDVIQILVWDEQLIKKINPIINSGNVSITKSFILKVMYN